jgi:hypothetical protein
MTKIYWLNEKARFFVERRNGMTKDLLSSNCTDTVISLFPSAKRVKGRFGFSPAVNILLIVLMVFMMAGCGSSSSSSSNSLPPLTDALWIGFQNGEDGDWQEIELPENNVLDIAGLNPTDGKYGLAVVLASAAAQRVTSFTILATVSELPEVNFNELFPIEESATLQVTLEEPAGFTNSYVRLNLHGDYSGVSSGFTYTRSFYKTPGTYDLIVTRADSYDDTPTHLEERRDLTLTDGVTLEETIASDTFDGSNALLGPYSIRVLNEDSSTMDRSLYDGDVTLLTANDTEAELGEKETDDNTNIPYAALGSLLDADDIYMLHISIEPDDNSFITYFEGFDTAGDKDVTPPSDPLAGEFDSVTSGDNLLPGLTGTTYTDAIGYTTQYYGTADGVDYRVSGHVSLGRSVAYISGTDISFFIPELSSAPGWAARWSIPITATMDYTAVSVQVGETGVTLENFADWYFGGTSRLADGEWFASIAKIVYSDSGGGNL